jgi:hypothetical protein
MPHPGNVQTWLNPPTDTWPERWVLLELDPDKTRIAAEAFAAQADAINETDSQRARVLRSLAYQFRHAVLTPEEADKKNISTLDTMHPANQLSRLLGTALTQFARWSGPVTLVVNALQHAAAIAAHRNQEAGVREVVTTARQKATSLEWTAFGPVGPIGDDTDTK